MTKTGYRSWWLLAIISLVLLVVPFTCTNGALGEESVEDNYLWCTSGDKVDSIKLIWNRYTVKGYHDSAILSVRPYFTEALVLQDSQGVLTSGASIAQSFLMKEISDSVKYYLSILEPYMKANTDPALGIFVNNIAGSYSLKYDLDYSSALQSFKLAYEWALKEDDIENQAVMLANIVNIFYVMSDKGGLKYSEMAQALSIRPEMSGYAKALVFVSMAEMTFLSGDYDGTVKYLNEAQRLSNKSEVDVVLPVIYLLYGDTYNTEGDFELSKSYYIKALSMSEVAEPAMVSKIYLNYGSLCEKISDYDKAIELYQAGLDLSYQYRNMEFRRELLDRLSDLKYLIGDKESSLEYYRQYREHIDSISGTAKEKEFNDLLVSYREVEHKAEMQEKELALMKAKRRSLYIGVILLIIVVVLVSLWIIYTRQQKMYRTLVLQHQSYLQQLEKDSVSSDVVEPNISADGDLDDKSAEHQLFLRLEELVKNKKIYSQKDLSLDKIAELLGTNRTYVSKAINDVAGTSYYNYIDMFRIREATRIISESYEDIPFKQLSDELGYNSISVFYKAFRNATGCTPGQYRSQIKQIHKEKQD